MTTTTNTVTIATKEVTNEPSAAEKSGDPKGSRSIHKRRSWFRATPASELGTSSAQPDTSKKPPPKAKKNNKKPDKKPRKTMDKKTNNIANNNKMAKKKKAMGKKVANEATKNAAKPEDPGVVQQAPSYSTTGMNEDERKILFRKSLNVLAQKYLEENQDTKQMIMAADSARVSSSSSSSNKARQAPAAPQPTQRRSSHREAPRPQPRQRHQQQHQRQESFDETTAVLSAALSAFTFNTAQNEANENLLLMQSDYDEYEEDEAGTLGTGTTGSATYFSQDSAASSRKEEAEDESTLVGTSYYSSAATTRSTPMWPGWAKVLLACTVPTTGCGAADRDYLYPTHIYPDPTLTMDDEEYDDDDDDEDETDEEDYDETDDDDEDDDEGLMEDYDDDDEDEEATSPSVLSIPVDQATAGSSSLQLQQGSRSSSQPMVSPQKKQRPRTQRGPLSRASQSSPQPHDALMTGPTTAFVAAAATVTQLVPQEIIPGFKFPDKEPESVPKCDDSTISTQLSRYQFKNISSF